MTYVILAASRGLPPPLVAMLIGMSQEPTQDDQFEYPTHGDITPILDSTMARPSLGFHAELIDALVISEPCCTGRHYNGDVSTFLAAMTYHGDVTPETTGDIQHGLRTMASFRQVPMTNMDEVGLTSAHPSQTSVSGDHPAIQARAKGFGDVISEIGIGDVDPGTLMNFFFRRRGHGLFVN